MVQVQLLAYHHGGAGSIPGQSTCVLAGPGWNCRSILVMLQSCLQTCTTYTISECTMNKLLMMGRGTVRNMQSFISNKFVKLVHLVGFIITKFVTMHSHMNVKFRQNKFNPFKTEAHVNYIRHKTSFHYKRNRLMFLLRRQQLF